MKKHYGWSILLFLMGFMGMYAQNGRSFPYVESFEEGIPPTWKVVDEDGDGKVWMVKESDDSEDPLTAHSGNKMLISYTYSMEDYQDLDPNDWLISSDVTGATTLKFYLAVNTLYEMEHYAVYASKTGNSAADFMQTPPLKEETILLENNKGIRNLPKHGRGQSKWMLKTVKLPEGTKYVAFRHFESSGHGDYLLIDDITFEGGEVVNLNPIEGLTATIEEDKVTLNWQEPFENSSKKVVLKEDFEGDNLSGWTNIDVDLDGYKWEHKPNILTGFSNAMGHDSEGMIASLSFAGGVGALQPNNYLITPVLELQEGGRLTFWVSPLSIDYAQEHYSVCVSKTGNAIDDFTEVLLEETLERGAAAGTLSRPSDIRSREQGEWVQKTVMLPAGTKYVAFRHFNCTDLFGITLDDVEIVAEGNNPVAPYTYTVYRDGELVAEGLTGTVYVEENVSAGEHDYCIRVQYSEGLSPKKCISANIENTSLLNPVTNLEGNVQGDKVSIKWNAPQKMNKDILLTEEFDGGSLPAGWTTIDGDEDGHNWRWSAEAGAEDFKATNQTDSRTKGLGNRDSRCMVSESSVFNASNYTWTDLQPDNYLITPDITGATKVSYKVGSAGGPNYAAEHYAVCVSFTDLNKDNFEIIHEETLTFSNQAPSLERNIEIPAGAKYIAFRHFNCTAMLSMLIDDVVVSGESVSAPYTYTVYRDGILVAEGLTETKYEEDNVPIGSHDYCVEVKYSTGLSPRKCITVNIGSFAPVVNLEGKAEDGDIVLHWNAPEGEGGDQFVINEDFESKVLPDGWTTIDADGDGYTWNPDPNIFFYTGHDFSAGMIASASFISGIGTLTPDNYLVTPILDLPEGGVLTFWVCAQHPDYPTEHYAVYASSGGNLATDFVNPLLEETLQGKKAASGSSLRNERAQGEWMEKSVQLPAGTKYVAFRHFDSTDQYWIDLDDVKIISAATNVYTYTVYRDEVKIAEGLTETSYRDKTMTPPGPFGYCVEVQYTQGVSPKECITVPYPKYKATAIQPDHGTIGLKADGQLLNSGDMLAYGTEIEVVLTPDEGYEFDEVFVNGVLLASPYIFTLKEDAEVTAVMKQINPLEAVSSDVFEVYPIPARTFITLEVPVAMIGETVFMTDLSGRLVLSMEVRERLTRLDVSRLSQGTYFLRIGSLLRKVIIE